MKKLPLAIAITTLLTASTSFAIDSSDTTSLYDAKIFNKSFEVSVRKESEIIIDPPEIESITLDTARLEDVANNNDNIVIGSMVVATTATTCYASIRTANNFKLQGDIITADGTRNTLANYGLHYMVRNNTAGTAVMDAQFSSNSDGERLVGCNTADLKMKVFNYNSQAPVDAYNDIITLEVRAES
jgi:hypothetical protein